MPKRRFLSRLGVALAVFVSGGCSDTSTVINPPPLVVDGSGVMTTETRSVGAFTGVSFSSEGDVHIEQAAQESLQVHAEANLQPYLLSDVQSGTLGIWTESNVDLRPTMSIDFDVTVTTLDRVDHNGVGNIEIDDLNANQLSLVRNGVGDIDLTNLDATQLTVTLGGVGEMAASGNVDRQEIAVSGVGNYEAENLASADAVVLILGQGSATVRVSNSLAVAVTGTGSVFYYGDPGSVTGPATRLGP
jgi:hypothetical protein